jgi:hypothetical protein
MVWRSLRVRTGSDFLRLAHVGTKLAVAATGFFLFGSLARRAGVLPTVAIGQAPDGVGGEMLA